MIQGTVDGNDGPVSEPTMKSGDVTALRRRNENHPEDTRSNSDNVCENRSKT